MSKSLEYIVARLSESSTWSSIAALLLALHIKVEAGAWQAVTLYGMVGAALLAIVLREAGNKPPMEIATDVLDSLQPAVDAARKAGALAVLLLAATAVTLGGCTADQVAAAQRTVATVHADIAAVRAVAASAVATYPIIKGLAEVAAQAAPGLAGAINQGIARLDPIVATAAQAIANGSDDADALATLSGQIVAQTQALTQVAAPAIVVVPGPVSR